MTGIKKHQSGSNSNWPLPNYQTPEEFQMNNILHDITYELDDRPTRQPKLPMIFKLRPDFVRRHLCWILLSFIFLLITLSSVVTVSIIARQRSHAPTTTQEYVTRDVTILQTMTRVESKIASTTYSSILSSTVTTTQSTTLVTTQSTTEITTLSSMMLSTITQLSIATTVIEGQTVIQQNTVTAVIVVTQSVIDCVLCVEPSAADQLKSISRPPGDSGTTLSTTSMVATSAK